VTRHGGTGAIPDATRLLLRATLNIVRSRAATVTIMHNMYNMYNMYMYM